MVRVAAEPKNAPPEVAALLDVVRAAQAAGGKIADVVKLAEKAFGPGCMQFSLKFIIPALIFGFIAGIVASYRGLHPKPGPKGVGDAVNESVVIAFVLLFVVNVILTAIYLQVVPAKGA